MEDIIQCMEKVAEDQGWVEVVYVNNLLLDKVFNYQFGGVTRVLQSLEKTSDNALKMGATAGTGGAILQLFLDLKASISAEKTIGEKTKSIFERELTIDKKIRLCEVSLENSGSIMENPAASGGAAGKYFRFVDLLSTFSLSDEERLRKATNPQAAELILEKWARDQKLTPDSPQVALVSSQPFLMAGFVVVQRGLDGSTYIAYPPPEGVRRSVLAEKLFQEEGVVFLKIYWIVDKRK